MQITQFSDYALRFLMDLAVTPDRSSTVEELAQRHNVSRHHATKVVRRLGQLGCAKTTRGKNGGVRLGRPAQEINVGQLVRETENLTLVECLGPANTCRIAPSCVLKGIFSRALEAFLAELDQHTLADLAAPREAILHDLGLQKNLLSQKLDP